MAIVTKQMRSRKSGNPISNTMQKASTGLQRVGRQIRTNLKQGQQNSSYRKADFAINPMQGTGGAFTSAFKK